MWSATRALTKGDLRAVRAMLAKVVLEPLGQNEAELRHLAASGVDRPECLGDYRIQYDIERQAVVLHAVRHRKEVYRR